MDDGREIALALSGGGARAMAFHLGVLRALAERGYLERVTRVSSVSGGSLVVGLVFQRAGMAWPSSAQFLAELYPALRQDLCSASMQWGAFSRLINPLNWRFALSRANLLALTLRHSMGIEGPLASLPAVPEWSIQATNAENGRRFRFKRHSMGDYLTGYASTERFPLASAMAVSAAFPGAFGPLSLKTRRFVWRKRPWGVPEDQSVEVTLPWRHLHLYDGGVYDNLGLESFFDAGTSQSKCEGAYILVSDAGKPLGEGFSFGPLNPFRLMHVADIMSDQNHALRVRTFHGFLKKKPADGALLSIGDQSDDPGLREFAIAYPTNLCRLSLHAFDKLASHGYRLMSARDC